MSKKRDFENEDNLAMHLNKEVTRVMQNVHKLVFKANPNEGYTLY